MSEGILICGRDDRDLAASGDRPRWPAFIKRLRWSFTGPLLQPFSDIELKGCFEEAWRRWSSVCNLTAEYVSNAATAHVVIGFGAIDGPSKVLAYSELADGTERTKRQTYDSSERFTIADNPPADRIDLIRVATHEIGHVIGIPHIGTGNLMAPTYSQQIRGPQTGDVAEAMARYGPAVPVTPPQPPDVPTSRTVKHLSGGYAICEDGTMWRYEVAAGVWLKLPTIPNENE